MFKIYILLTNPFKLKKYPYSIRFVTKDVNSDFFTFE